MRLWNSKELKIFFNLEREEILNDNKNKIEFTLENKIFRPKVLSEYIGQKNIKEIINSYINAIKEKNLVFPHILISGAPGYGKTTLALIIINLLNKKFYQTIGSNISNDFNFINIINKLEGGSLYIDEIHALERNMVEKLYPLMEDFKDIQPFTLIGSTTELGSMIKDREPFVDRFKLLIELENYNIEDLVKIACQYKNKVFENENINNSIYLKLAQNCRNTPRLLLRLLEATIYFNGEINKVLKSFGIIKNGLNIKDFKVLEYINSNSSGVGLNSIALYINTSQENYLYSIEPYLLQNGLITRTHKGRKITEKGKIILEELKNEQI